MSETVHIARSSYTVASFYEKKSEQKTRMEKQSGNRGKVIKEIKRSYENHQLIFQM